ncbi:hypothetical protein [Conyzicola sp.]|uniref:hypothetical protein n=1 Tax=Conyzicola sp. TaxID=1969404 RepID=UPI003988BA56
MLAVVVVMAIQLAALVPLAWASLHGQRITDQLAVWDFEPSAELAGYVERSTMTELGEFLFYATHPEVNGKAEFDSICSSDEEGVGTLGCYLPASSAIHLYDITDERLDGMEEVIAAHEMLHAAWARMGDAELAAISPLLEAQAVAMEGDPAFVERMDFYARSEPGERLNELHSILGTEVAALDPRLEQHYADLFTDRQHLVGLFTVSHQVFVDLENRAEALVAELEALSASIEADYSSYTSGFDQLDADVEAFNARADSGDFPSQAQFARERNALLQRQEDLDALYASISARDASYQTKLAELDGLNADVDDLNSSINIAPRSGDGL